MSDKASSLGMDPLKVNGNGIMEKKDNLPKSENKKTTETIEITNAVLPIQSQTHEQNKPLSQINRCNLAECNKKLSLVESTIKCKCGNTYCTLHRYSEKHNCIFDYKADSEKSRKKTLVQVTAAKINKI